MVNDSHEKRKKGCELVYWLVEEGIDNARFFDAIFQRCVSLFPFFQRLVNKPAIDLL